MHILVTGSHGYIGDTLVKSLRDHNHTLELCDLKDSTDIFALTPNKDWDCIVHLAALSSVPLCQDDRGVAFHANVYGAYLMAKLAKDSGAHLIFASSCSVEEPNSVYAVTKLAAESVIKATTPATILRLANVAGGHHDSTTHLIPNIVRAVLNPVEHPLKIYNNNARDYIHINDVVCAIYKSIDRGHNATIQVGTGRATTVMEVVMEVVSIYDLPCSAVYMPQGTERGDEPKILVATPEDMQEKLSIGSLLTLTDIIKSTKL